MGRPAAMARCVAMVAAALTDSRDGAGTARVGRFSEP